MPPSQADPRTLEEVLAALESIGRTRFRLRAHRLPDGARERAVTSWVPPAPGSARPPTGYQSPFRNYKTKPEGSTSSSSRSSGERSAYAYPGLPGPSYRTQKPPSPPTDRDMDAAMQLADLSRGRSSSLSSAPSTSYGASSSSSSTSPYSYHMQHHPYAARSDRPYPSVDQSLGFAYNRTPPLSGPSSGYGEPSPPMVDRQARRLSAMSIDLPSSSPPTGAERISIASLTRQDPMPPSSRNTRRFSFSGLGGGGGGGNGGGASRAGSPGATSTSSNADRRSFGDRFKNVLGGNHRRS
jgi:hypothetical protein